MWWVEDTAKDGDSEVTTPFRLKEIITMVITTKGKEIDGEGEKINGQRGEGTRGSS